MYIHSFVIHVRAIYIVACIRAYSTYQGFGSGSRFTGSGSDPRGRTRIRFRPDEKQPLLFPAEMANENKNYDLSQKIGALLLYGYTIYILDGFWIKVLDFIQIQIRAFPETGSEILVLTIHTSYLPTCNYVRMGR